MSSQNGQRLSEQSGTTFKDSLYNHMMDIAFSVVSGEEDNEKLGIRELIRAARKRLDSIEESGSEDYEAFGFSDSYEMTFDEGADEFNAQLDYLPAGEKKLLKALLQNYISQLSTLTLQCTVLQGHLIDHSSRTCQQVSLELRDAINHLSQANSLILKAKQHLEG